jgi:predicted nucleic acid-binding protein
VALRPAFLADKSALARMPNAAVRARLEPLLVIPDLVIAAAAESFGLTVLRYDADFEHIAEVTGQSHNWVVPRGTV